MVDEEQVSPATTQDSRKNEKGEKLDSNHVIMIALSGSLGIGLLIGTGSVLAEGGPGTMLLGYAVVGVFVYFVMCAVAEVSAYIPMAEGFVGYASRYVDRGLATAVGYAYYTNYLIVTPHQITAGAMLLQYWIDRETLNPGVFIAIFYVAALLINFLGGVKFIKVFEYWMSATKIAVLAICAVVLLVFSAGGGPDHTAKGFQYWKEPGAFKEYNQNGVHIPGSLGKFLAFLSIGVTTVFSYLGVELVAVTVGETSHPRKNVPRAVKLTFVRTIGFFLVIGLFLGMLIPWNDKSLIFGQGVQQKGVSASPFLVAFQNSGAAVGAHILNAFFIAFIVASSVAALYIGTKTLNSLAKQRLAPAVFQKELKNGVPHWSMAITSVLCSTCFLNCAKSSAKVFDYFVSFSALLGLLTWITILVTHICFMQALKAQGIDRDSLAYKAPLQPFMSYFTLVVCCILALGKNFPVFIRAEGAPFDTTTFVVGYIALPLFIALAFGYKWVTKCKRVAPAQADLTTGKQQIDNEEKEWVAQEQQNTSNGPIWKRVAGFLLHILF